MYRRVKNASFESVLVRISASCLSVGVYVICTPPYFTFNLKWWYFNVKCLVCGENLVPAAIFIQDWLSSWTRHTDLGFCMRRGDNLLISSTIIISNNTSRKAYDIAMYSTYEVFIAVFVCNDLRQYIGQFIYMMTILVSDIIFSASLESVCCQTFAKSASTYHSKPFFVLDL